MERKHQSKNHYAGRTLCCHNPNWRSREGTLSPTGAPGSFSLYKFSVSPRQWRTPAPLPTPLHLPADPRCTYRPFLEAGARCRLPRAGSLACPLCHAGCGTSTSVLQSTVTASWAEGRRHQERGDWGGGHLSTSGLPLPPEIGGLCQASRSPLPAHWVAGLLVEDAGPGAGWVGGGVSSCWLPAPAASLKPLAPTRAAAPRCFPRSS